MDFFSSRLLAERAIRDDHIPGIVWGVDDFKKGRHGGRHTLALGNRRVEPTEQGVHRDTVFDLASLTKVLVTAPLVFRFIEKGELKLEDPLVKFFPNFQSKEIQIHHLMSHSSGLPAWKPFYESLLKKADQDFPYLEISMVPLEARKEWMLEECLAVKPEIKAGEQAVYSDLGHILLTYILEKIANKDFDELSKEEIFDPCSLYSFHFKKIFGREEELTDEEVAATEDCPWRRIVLQGMVHDDNCYAMGGVSGHAGLFGSIKDVLEFSRLLWEGKILKKETVELMWRREGLPKNTTRTLGWDTPSPQGSSAGHRFSPRSVGHLGFTGTSLWIDPEAECAVSILTNRVHPHRENAKEEIKKFRPEMHDAIRVDLGR